MEFFSHPFSGDTDATQMLKDTFRMLDENRYMNADVLLISDYRIPECKPELLEQMSVHRERVLAFTGSANRHCPERNGRNISIISTE